MSSIGMPPLSSPSALIQTYNPQDLLKYVVDVLRVTLGADDGDLRSNESLISDEKRSETVEKCRRFASSADTIQSAIYVSKIQLPNDEEAPSDSTCMPHHSLP